MAKLLDEDKVKKITLRQAAAWLGCSPNFIRVMRRAGWIKSCEQYESNQGGFLPVAKCTFWLVDLQILAWDIAYSLSFYDLLAIRKSKDAARTIARKGGIPVRVVELVQEAYVFGWVVALCERYSSRRSKTGIAKADVNPPFPPNPFTLSLMLPKLFAQECKALNLGSASPVRSEFGSGSSSPSGIEMPFEQKLFSPRGIARPSRREGQPQLWTLDQLRQAEQELAQEAQQLHEPPTEQQCQTESEPGHN